MGMKNRKAATPYRAALEVEKAAFAALQTVRVRDPRYRAFFRAWIDAKSAAARLKNKGG